MGTIGAGIYSTRGEPRFRSRPIANNGLIVSESDGKQRIECVSSHSVPGVFTGLNGNILTNTGIWRVGHPFDRPGVRCLKTDDGTPLTAADQAPALLPIVMTIRLSSMLDYIPLDSTVRGSIYTIVC